MRRADHPAVGLILDSFHTLARRIDVESIRAIPGDRIFIVQLANAPRIDMDLLYWSRHFRNMPGQGDLAVVDFMRAVAATGYDGPISLEIFNDQFRGGSPRTVAVDGWRSLVNLMDEVHRAEPDIAMAVPDLPPRVAVKGVEFIEFAANEEEAERLSRLLAGMGFTLAARHKTRDVVVWRQGPPPGIAIVVNTAHEGFAHSSYIVHGMNAYAIGLRVEDAAATAARARGLGADVFAEQRGPGEIAIPAVRGVGGGVIYFIDDEGAKVWDVEFDAAVPAGPPSQAGLVRIDHIAQTMPYEEMLTWVLFYTAIFATRKSPMVDVIDPGGVVRSQVIDGADGTFRLTLNGAENHRTLAGHFIAERFGSAVQHVAFETHDIFATAAALERDGTLPRLRISPNYFDDLEARFGLDPELIERLRAYDILYDRDATGGEYFQLYSGILGEGFFFEIVERRGGYQGYGAPNAPFRIAAQKQLLRPAGMPRIAPGD